MTALSGPYYAFFGTFVILVGGLIGLLRRPGLDRVIDTAAAAGLVIVIFAAQLVPNAIFVAQSGVNPVASKRSENDYYVYGLGLVNLLKPVPVTGCRA